MTDENELQFKIAESVAIMVVTIALAEYLRCNEEDIDNRINKNVETIANVFEGSGAG